MAPVDQTKRTFTLNTGDKIPAVGLGTWQSAPSEVYHAVLAALKHGYRHIDTALAYGNENEVGAAIRDSGVPRADIWVTTKLDNPWHKRVPEGIDASLKHLGLDYVDLYLMHWPSSTDPADLSKHHEGWDFVDTWRELQKLAGTGKVRNLGVSNFGIKNLERLLNDPSCKIVPAVNQIELHPCNPSPSSSPTTPPRASTPPATRASAAPTPPVHEPDPPRHRQGQGPHPQQVLLMWGLQKGWSVIPKSVSESRIQANWDVDGWELTDDEVAQLDAIPDRFKVCGDAWLPIRVFFGDDE
ncbi:unnamed protein product [Parascedosporium putredinis]|uniref:NADP-dependent oxidoreductase domain-containing protein n=1 Tax=Parascedosporium putredinis TaxID=1442378 RepID=A0A9P1M842_9PEZI|nr:unnamed protein product [Parascedosporium putredinis]CAI7989427.1 unnamed protein product [Parascedosporium putredinis]